MDFNHTYVQEYDLGHQGSNDEDDQDVDKPVLELRSIGPSSLCCDSSANALDADHTETTDETAHGNVHHHGFLSISWTNPKSYEGARKNDNSRVTEKSRRDDEFLHVLNGIHSTLFRRIGCNNHGPNNALEASNLAHKTQTLFQEYSRQNGADNDGKGAERGDENGIGEKIGCKVANFCREC